MNNQEFTKTCTLINEALNMIHACMKVIVRESAKLNEANREAMEELKRREITPENIIKGGKL